MIIIVDLVITDSNSSAEESDELTENQFEQESGEDDFASEDDEESDGEVENESADDVTTSDQSEAGEEEAGEEEEGEGGGVTALPVKSLVENAEKGEMARKQMSKFDLVNLQCMAPEIQDASLSGRHFLWVLVPFQHSQCAICIFVC